MLHAVILAGGSGLRFWPVSQRNHPKQFLALAGDDTLLQQTLRRLDGLIPPEQVLVSTREAFSALVLEQLPELSSAQLLLEPAPRDTAPCLAVAAAIIAARDPEATLVILPSDHLIADVPTFHRALRLAEQAVEDDPQRMILIGAIPTSPATGYGYVETGPQIAGAGKPLSAAGPTLHEVQSFREKPDLQTANEYLATSRFLWSCGIFVWKAKTFLDVLSKSAPDLALVLEELATIDRMRSPAAWNKVFLKFRPISVDYAVLEHAPKLGVVRADFGWDDLGSWEATARHLPADDHGNVVRGHHVGIETKDCIIHSSGDHLIATCGIDDLVIVHTQKATLIARRGDESALKKLVAEVEKSAFAKP
jgi:mannose-1-phosphate guanylyltransferase